MFTAFGLYVAIITSNGDIEESVPYVYDTLTECMAQEKLISAQVYESACFQGTFKKNVDRQN